MQASSRPTQRLAKGVTACQRCRRRKQKCDLKSPNCSNCESARSPCLTYHSGKQAEIPRNYVANLEAQLESTTRENRELRKQNEELRMQIGNSASVNTESPTPVEPCSPTRIDLGILPTASSVTSNASTNHFQNLVKSVRSVVVEPSRQPRFLGQSSGITLARMVMVAIRIDSLPSSLSSKQNSYDPFSSVPTAEASLPPRHAADHLVGVYFQYRTPHLPIVNRAQVEKAVEGAYRSRNDPQSSDQITENDIFTAYMIFAIALCDVPNPSGGRPSQSEGCFRSAIGSIEKIIAYSKNDLETLRAILLLAQFVSLCPSHGSLWHLTGFALRLCVDIGLHWETEEQSSTMDPDLLHERRRLWYSTYQFDRVLCITLGRPLGIIDESTNVPLPNPWNVSRGSLTRELYDFDIHTQRAHNHMFNMSKLESEIKHVLHTQAWTPKISSPRIDYSTWVQDIQPRLQQWYTAIPRLSQAHPASIFAHQAYWDVIYNNAILLLYRPASIVIQVSSEELVMSFEASCKLIASIKILQRDGKIDVLWKSVHHLFMAGLGVIYGLWHSKEIRNRNSVSKNISTLQSCASTLSAMSENFPGAAGCRDVFDTLSSTTVDFLVANNAEDVYQNRIEFEKQMRNLVQQLQPSSRGIATTNEISGDNTSTLLSADNFAFSEMLSFAAQWPDLQDVDFGDIGLDPMMGT
ncbi:hypothetical protein BELL_0406g00120 [Botrytis elliptica]|uniref:Zn(2)-C6 fungal-type domain-containing protein n=1 Tax=Botrytis elliptica TaxID=278938 RepID=A0A4Z1JGV4_9HELO|nr:hypothetical protein EAE99_009571 [Botrytis elliptica]TGO72929.1 hypothetical protein BELL_0406g00120 [Botrytis elliptica]